MTYIISEMYSTVGLFEILIYRIDIKSIFLITDFLFILNLVYFLSN